MRRQIYLSILMMWDFVLPARSSVSLLLCQGAGRERRHQPCIDIPLIESHIVLDKQEGAHLANTTASDAVVRSMCLRNIRSSHKPQCIRESKGEMVCRQSPQVKRREMHLYITSLRAPFPFPLLQYSSIGAFCAFTEG